MSKRIIGVTVGTTLPKPNFKQTDPTKGDYIKNKPDFDGLKNRVDTVSGLVGDTAVSEQIDNAIANIEIPDEIYVQNDEPLNAPDGSVWIDLDAEVNTEPEIVIDASLTQSGQAADAKVVGEALAKKQPVGDYATVTYVDNAIGAIPTPDVSGQINAHNIATDAHSDIRTLVGSSANTTLDNAKTYTDTKISEFVGDSTVSAQIVDAIKNKANTSDLDSHTGNKSNPHGVTASQVGAYTKTETDTLLNKKANDYSLEIYNGTSGNPKPVRFMTVNYSTCGSEAGVAVKLGMVSGHGNGSSYAFLQDAIIRVTHTGNVEVDNFKYYGAATGTYDGANRQYGDIFWTIDTTNKVVDFYCLMGQYARIQMTPYKRVTYSTGGTITQYTSCTVYSSGEKVWANNSDIALMSDIKAAIEAIPTPDVGGQISAAINPIDARLSALESSVVTVHSGDTNPSESLGEEGDLYLKTIDTGEDLWPTS